MVSSVCLCVSLLDGLGSRAWLVIAMRGLARGRTLASRPTIRPSDATYNNHLLRTYLHTMFRTYEYEP